MDSRRQKTGLGISLYLKDFLEDPEAAELYLDSAAKFGFSEVFTSIHLPEDDFLKTSVAVREFAELVAKRGMHLAVDCSSHELKKIQDNASLKNELRRSEIAYLRLDFGFQTTDVRTISEELGIHGFMLNPSIMRKAEVVEMVSALQRFSKALAIKACHNFYPRPETGLGLAFFINQSAIFYELGIPVAACVPSRNKPRGPLHAGLPTLESHRHAAMHWAARELMATGVVDEILIGDPFASATELADLQEAASSPTLVIRVIEEEGLSETERRILYGTIHIARPDLSEWVLRSRTSREMAGMGEKLTAREAKVREANVITIDNEKYGRYSGELQIVRQELPADARVNVVGRISPEDSCLLRYIADGVEFRFVQDDGTQN
jgi:hypothetical protein